MSVRPETIQDRELPFTACSTHIDYVNYLKWASSIRLLWLINVGLFGFLFLIFLFFQFFFTLSWSFASSGKSSVTLIWYTPILWLSTEYSFNGTNSMGLEFVDFLLCVIALKERYSAFFNLIIKMSMTHWTQIVVLYSFFQQWKKKILIHLSILPLQLSLLVL